MLARIRYDRETGNVKEFCTELKVVKTTNSRTYVSAENPPPDEHIPSWVDTEAPRFRIFPSYGPEARYMGNDFESAAAALRVLRSQVLMYFDGEIAFLNKVIKNIKSMEAK